MYVAIEFQLKIAPDYCKKAQCALLVFIRISMVTLLIRFFTWMYLISSIATPVETMMITSRFLSLFAPLVQVSHAAEIVPNLLKGLVLVARFVVLFTVLGLEALTHALKTKSISPIESTVHQKHTLQLTKTMLPEKKTDIMPQTEHNTVIVTEQRAPLLDSTRAPTIVNETSVTELKAPILTEEEGSSIHEQVSRMEPLEEALAVVKEDVVTFEKEEPHVDKEELIIKENIPTVEDNKSVVEEEEVFVIEHDEPTVKNDEPTIKGNAFAVKEDIPATEDNAFAVKEDIPTIKDNVLAVKEDIPATEDDDLLVKVEELAVREKMPVDQQDSPTVKESEPAMDEDIPAASEDIPSLIESDIPTPTTSVTIPDEPPRTESSLQEIAIPPTEPALTTQAPATIKSDTISLSEKLQQILDLSPDNKKAAYERRPPPTPALTPNPSSAVSSVSRRSSMASQRSTALKNRLTTAVKKVASRSSSISGPGPANKKQTEEANKKRFSLGLARKKTTETVEARPPVPSPPPVPAVEVKAKRSVSTKLQRGLKKSGKKLAKIFS
ncbi:hypothetical protein EDC96DRAFT_568431 [Choanephora cucurbitarum]|nr:hypothetical protein EDC96DRAFT_568431 [Choanephora cucurbitarum]